MAPSITTTAFKTNATRGKNAGLTADQDANHAHIPATGGPDRPVVFATRAAPSPFLHPEQFGMLPLPESPVPHGTPLPHHLHTPSSSVTGESPRSVSAPFPLRHAWVPSTPTIQFNSEKGKERET
ncbi:uncharacterized protein ColSpa_09087 [Colletotrichum spaethianum]|uniref:Uncharacterized protein n=1 Tax=Colletotrichum spaethianum TaxID=700344 RepID=A0AA37PAX9_9PEZI|nr:uncharacterized protein ColSpa_09087 [Colletotrichum spaethianum]GKT48906.1 hypothetical protein ColSpa_09087 [Colletotrichum spaethianum]